VSAHGAKVIAALAVVATIGAFAYRFAAPRHHDLAGALDQAERLIAEGRLAEAGSLLLGRIAPARIEATPEESLRYETVHQAWLDAVKESRQARRPEPPVETVVPPPQQPVAPAPAVAVLDGEPTLRLAEADAEAGRFEAARMRFESAMSLGLSASSEAMARLGLAETLAALGDHAGARGRYAEIGAKAVTFDVNFRDLAAGSALDRIDAAIAHGEFEAALGYAEVAEPLVVPGSSAEVSLAVRRASTRLTLAQRLASEGDLESAKPLARAAAAEFLRADGLESTLGAPPEGFAAGTFARLAGESLRIVAGDSAADPSRTRPETQSEALATFLRAETRRDAGLAASRALLAAGPEARDGLIRGRLDAYASALADYDAIVRDRAADPSLRSLASSRAVECLVALNRVTEAIGRLEAIAAATPGSAPGLESLGRAIELARHARDAAAVERLLVAGRKALDSTPDAALAATAVPMTRADWRRAFDSGGSPTGLATVPDRP